MSSKSSIKRIPTGAVRLRFAGDLVIPHCDNKDYAGLFRRYQALFEAFANMNRDSRNLNYHLITALILTSHAKKAESPEERKTLFDQKNSIFLKIANSQDMRRFVAFKYLKSKNFLVSEYCETCKERNETEKLDRHDWKYCKACTVDRDFYNVLSMHHRFSDGFMTIFLSNDLIKNVRGLKIKKRGLIGEHKEEGRFEKFQYNVKNLDAIHVDDALQLWKRISS